MKIVFDSKRLVPLVVQDAETKQVLSLVYANRDALRKIAETQMVWRWSRSKKRLAMKGESSGNTQEIVELRKDCDGDALLALVKQAGTGACHLGGWSCFAEKKERSWGVLDELCRTIRERNATRPKKSYVASLLRKPAAIGEKLVEEAGELGEAMLEKPESEVIWEAADLLFFLLVTIEARGVDAEKVLDELKRRRIGGKPPGGAKPAQQSL